MDLQRLACSSCIAAARSLWYQVALLKCMLLRSALVLHSQSQPQECCCCCGLCCCMLSGSTSGVPGGCDGAGVDVDGHTCWCCQICSCSWLNICSPWNSNESSKFGWDWCIRRFGRPLVNTNHHSHSQDGSDCYWQHRFGGQHNRDHRFADLSMQLASNRMCA